MRSTWALAVLASMVLGCGEGMPGTGCDPRNPQSICDDARGDSVDLTDSEGFEGGPDAEVDAAPDASRPARDGGSEAGSDSAAETGPVPEAGVDVAGCGSCDDGNPCTRDRCLTAGCTHDPVLNGTICGGGECVSGQCIQAIGDGGEETGGGSDGGPADSSPGSDAAGADTREAGVADAGSWCTSAAACDDRNPCTANLCNSGVCSNPPQDGALCFGPDPLAVYECLGGACVLVGGDGGSVADSAVGDDGVEASVPPDGGASGCTAASCDDGNPCTTDVCSGGICEHTNVSDWSPCPGNPGDICVGGACQPPCGGNGGSCCAGPTPCFGAGTSCDPYSNTCHPCGGSCEICCGSTRTIPGSCSSGGSCTRAFPGGVPGPWYCDTGMACP